MSPVPVWRLISGPLSPATSRVAGLMSLAGEGQAGATIWRMHPHRGSLREFEPLLLNPHQRTMFLISSNAFGLILL